MREHMCLKCVVACVLSIVACSASVLSAQHLPTPQEQKRIDEAIANHIGDAPDDAGPFAKDLSVKLTPKAVEAAIRKVADWELEKIAFLQQSDRFLAVQIDFCVP